MKIVVQVAVNRFVRHNFVTLLKNPTSKSIHRYFVLRYLKKKILANSTKPISIGIVVFVGGAETKFQTYFPDFILGEKNLLGLKQSY